MTSAVAPTASWAPPAKAARLDGVQALRFLAALLVVIGHCQHEAVAALGPQAGWTSLIAFDWGLGVDIFFVISGFIMWHLMQDRFGQPGEATRFLRRRVLRIVPIYWLGTTLIALATLSTFALTESLPFALASYLFVPWPHPDGRGLFPVLTLGWTLNYEMMFYCVFALALTLPRRLGVALLLSVFAALFVAARIAPADAFMVRFWGDPIIFEFLFGVGLAALYRHRAATLPGWAALAMAATGFALATLSYQTGAYHLLARSLTGGVPALLIVGAVVCGPRMATAAWPARCAVLGGDASYALYLAHPFALKAVAAVAARLGLWATPAVPIIAMLAAAIIASLLIFRFVERPILAVLQRRFAQPAPQPGR